MEREVTDGEIQDADEELNDDEELDVEFTSLGEPSRCTLRTMRGRAW